MEMIFAAISMAVFAGVARALNRLGVRVCALCAGVFGTWFWIAALWAAGVLTSDAWRMAGAILMGGSVVGLLYQIEKRLPADANAVGWKIGSAIFGFAGVFAFWSSRFWEAAVLVAAAGFVALLARMVLPPRSSQADARIGTLVNKMKRCC